MSVLDVSSVYLSMPCIAITLMLTYKKNKRIIFAKTGLIKVLVSFFIIILMITLSQVIHGNDADELLKMTIFGFMLFVLALCIVCIYLNAYGENAFKFALADILCVAFINSLAAVLVLFSKELRELIYTVISTSPTNEIHLELGMRSSGLFYFGGSVMSMFNCLAMYFALVYKSNYKLKGMFFYPLAFVLAMGAFVSGRMGLMLIIIMFIFIMLTPYRISLVDKNKVFNLLIFSILSCVLVFIFQYEKVHHLLAWALEVFINYFNDGSVSSKSTTVLATMYKFPSNILIGDGYFSQEGIGSDSGYILIGFYFGVIGVLSYLTVFLLHSTVVMNCKNIILKRCLLFTIAIVIVGNFKDIYLFASNGVTQVYFIFLLFSLMSVKKNNSSIV